MPQSTHLDIVAAEAERMPEPSKEASDLRVLQMHATEQARSLAWLPGTRSSHFFPDRCRRVSSALEPVFTALQSPLPETPVSDDFRWLYDNLRLLYSDVQSARESLKPFQETPHVRMPSGEVAPRVAALANGYLAAVEYFFTDQTLASYVQAFQQDTVLNLGELWALVPSLKLALLEEIARRAAPLLGDPQGSYNVGVCIRSLRDIGQTSWKGVIEPLILFDRVLRQDPAGAYSRMDYESRELYRNQLVKVAKYSDLTEMEVAIEALALAREAQRQTYSDSRVALRQSHIGFYLLDQAGTSLLHRSVNYRPPLGPKIIGFLRSHPDELYLPAVELLTLAIMSAILLLLAAPYRSLWLILFSMVVLIVPCSQSAVQLVNYLITTLLPAQILPKLDFEDGIPDDCVTLVAIPTLLLNERQVRRLVDDLEVRYLGNHDPNIHFALLSDLPDARERSTEESPLIDFCAQLIGDLNDKYGEEQRGAFLLLHRHRVYNPREGSWMGWERKRGKLLDLNKLLRNEYDSFPVKVGDTAVLQRVRFVITLDSDTELPRGTAQRMAGALAHPLNQAIIDPEKNIVVAGYGILQPRVGVSVSSAARSRLASIYSGETGFDIYTRAISDIYQDLYGEGIFTGKGIYEVDTVHRVLDRRFPRNALLSHDLIEGAYSRAGLASDIEIIEDYPSHYSAYNRRKHRWLRGDWQIVGWLFSRVWDESGKQVANPISIISQWKIFDNLRRSLVEPATFLLFVFGWLLLPGPAIYWTIATVAILFVPTWCQFLFTLVRAAVTQKSEVARDAVDALFAENVTVFLTLTFLAHQALLSLDAVIRTLIRKAFTRRRLLEWETAAEAESGAARRAPVDMYLNWTPVVAIALGMLVWLAKPAALAAAVPILLLWACSKPVSVWLNSSPGELHETPQKDRLFLRRAALGTWRYFAEFSTEEHNWLVPDNVQEEPPAVAARISPTNLGFLVNARQVACEFGYLTVPEFAAINLRTLATIAKLRRYHGHLVNWYDTRTLEPLQPMFISSVDSGNLVASLWTLRQGCVDLLGCPILRRDAAEGLLDFFRAMVDLHACSRRLLSRVEKDLEAANWMERLLNLQDTVCDEFQQPDATAGHTQDVTWFSSEIRRRLTAIRDAVNIYAPWLLPEFNALRPDPALNLKPEVAELALDAVPEFIDTLALCLQRALRSAGNDDKKLLYQRLATRLPEARANVLRLIEEVQRIAAEAGTLADEMDFTLLLDSRRKLLSVGYDVQTGQLNPACYDLLASESRIGVFAAIAKEDIPQESWFLLGRAHTVDNGRPVLLSWTGTMFEYLMPALWMHTYPNTLLDRSRIAAVRSQQAYVSGKRIPWGISESAYFKLDGAGNYQYHAFGLPQLALRKRELNALVISPYSTFLSLSVDAAAALANLHTMDDKEWFGSYGFYEAADFSSPQRRSWRHRYELVKCWMAHHQGMSLLSIANFLREGVVQQWFHADPRVQATELLLHEKPVSHVRPEGKGYGSAAA